MALKEVIAFVNNKGGVGKTSSVQNVAASILRNEKKAKILCVDLDPQCNLSSLMGWTATRKNYPHHDEHSIITALNSGEPGTLAIYEHAPRWYYVPSNTNLEGIEIFLNSKMTPKQMLGRILFGEALLYDKQKEGEESVPEAKNVVVEDYFDYIIIDCAPSLGTLTINALDAADSVAIPVEPEGFSIGGLGRILNAVKEVNTFLRGKGSPKLDVRGIFFVKVETRTNIAKGVMNSLKESYGPFIMESYVRKCNRIKEAQIDAKDIYEYDSSCAAAKDYDAVTLELLKRIKNKNKK